MSRCLLIGGSHDGETVEIPEAHDHIQLPKSPKGEFCSTLPPLNDCFEREIYRAEKFGTIGKSYRVFILDGITIDDVLSMLLDGYRKA